MQLSFCDIKVKDPAESVRAKSDLNWHPMWAYPYVSIPLTTTALRRNMAVQWVLSEFPQRRT